jgi:hypothetical protein
MTLTHNSTITLFNTDIDIEVIYWSDPEETLIHAIGWAFSKFTDEENKQIEEFCSNDKLHVKLYKEIENAN